MLALNEKMLEEVSGGTNTTTNIFAKLKINKNSFNGNTQYNSSTINNGNNVFGIGASGFIVNSVTQVNSIG